MNRIGMIEWAGLTPENVGQLISADLYMQMILAFQLLYSFLFYFFILFCFYITVWCQLEKTNTVCIAFHLFLSW